MFKLRLCVFLVILFNVYAEVILKNLLAPAFETSIGNKKVDQIGTFNEFNAPCKTTKDCRNFGYVCRFNKSCQCAHMYIPDENGKTCVGGVNQKCSYDEHCIKGAFCMNQEVCKCKESTPMVLEKGLVCSGGKFIVCNNFVFLLMSAFIIIIFFV